LQTAGSRLVGNGYARALRSLAEGRRLRIKLSYDPGHVQARKCAETALMSLGEEGFPSDKLEVNYVCSREGVERFGEFLGLLQSRGVAVKALDLIWYSDIGNRLGSTQASGFFRENYQPMGAVRQNLAKKGYKLVGLRSKVFGVIEEEYDNASGHRVRVRDSTRGTTYVPVCTTCSFWVLGLCQEGIYQLEITSGHRLKVCRHRPELAISLDEALTDDLAAGKTGRTEAALQKCFHDYYSGVWRDSRFSAP
jgi:hypothetical protein